MTIAVDFDGTLVTHQFPRVGNPAPNAVEVIQGLQKDYGVKVILYTMRDDQHYFNPITGKVEPITSQLQAAGCKSCLKEAVDYCERNGIILYGINKNPGQARWSYSRKVHADLYIDDAAAGAPMIDLANGERCIDWLAIQEIVLNRLNK